MKPKDVINYVYNKLGERINNSLLIRWKNEGMLVSDDNMDKQAEQIVLLKCLRFSHNEIKEYLKGNTMLTEEAKKRAGELEHKILPAMKERL